ncbi:MAG: hypothetical protein JO115_20495 [Pseudonocardiales bacterium]|nr:hypothetical protein [Pseudonocardiales bacterium]
MTSRMEQLTLDIRRTPLFRQVVPQEAGVGWPMPFRTQGKVYVSLLCFGYGPARNSVETAIFPPLALITVDWATGRPVEYLDLRFRHPWPDDQSTGQVGVFPHQAVARLSVNDYKRLRGELFAKYDELLEYLSAGKPFPGEFTEDFQRRLRLLMEPGLEPYYRALSPDFFGRFMPATNEANEGPRQEAVRR